MNRTLVAISFFVIFSSLGCAASVPMATKEQDIAAKKFTSPASGSRIYLFRDETFGYAISMPVVLDGKVVGGTAAQTYFMWNVTPGQHQIQSLTENISAVTLDTSAGKTYFVWQEVKMGFAQARSDLQVVDEVRGRKSVAQCKLIKSP